MRRTDETDEYGSALGGRCTDANHRTLLRVAERAKERSRPCGRARGLGIWADLAVPRTAIVRGMPRGQASKFVLLTLLLRETSKEFERGPLEVHPPWSFLELVSEALVGRVRPVRKEGKRFLCIVVRLDVPPTHAESGSNSDDNAGK